MYSNVILVGQSIHFVDQYYVLSFYWFIKGEIQVYRTDDNVLDSFRETIYYTGPLFIDNLFVKT